MTEAEFEKRFDILEDVSAKFVENVSASQRSVYDDVIAELNSLEVKNGSLVMSKSNLAKVEKIMQKIAKVLNTSDYAKAVDEFLKYYANIPRQQNKYFKTIFEDFTKSSFGMAIVASQTTNAYELLLGGAMNSEFILPVKTIITDSISSGATYLDLNKAIREFIVGTKKKQGKLARYSKQVSYDSIAITDQSYTQAVSEELGIEFFKYSGGTISDTREFCAVRANKYYHKKEIMGWANLNWDGKFLGTNSKTIFQLRGGYNCRHSIIPVSTFSVPKSDIERNIKNGNFKPTEKMKKLLGID